MVVSFSVRLLIVGAMALGSSSVSASAFKHPAEQAAMPSRFASTAPLLAVASAGKRLVAVGVRGHIVTSDDNGSTWHQSAVPVSTDLVAVSFPSASQGWAVGHGGVVLHSADGGATWSKQLSGRASSEIALRYYESAAAAGGDFAKVLQREMVLAKDSGTPSFLDVYFVTNQVGYVVGTFNRIFRTDDGGKTWEPWMHRTENPQGFNFYGVRERNGQWYLAGEQGVIWQLDPARKQFSAVPTPYKGTFFGLMVDSTNQLLAYGMRGSLYRSADQGKSWAKTEAGTSAGITGATALPDGRLVLANQAGGFSVSADHGNTFVQHSAAAPMSNFGVTPLPDGRLVFVGSLGVHVEKPH